jgi:macrolide transport system ATP-binding/permease protein
VSICLACLGVYALTSYSVARRTPEFGVMIALGASKKHILTLVLRDGLTMFLAGASIGSLIGVLAVQVTSKLVIAMPSVQAPTVFYALLSVFSAVAAASYFPARNATSVDPMFNLRNQ